MRRSIVAALAAALILTTASPALASDGWSPYKGHWVHWQTTSAAVLQPESSAWLHYQSEVAHAIVKAEKANDRYRAAIRAAEAAAAVRTAPRPSQGASYAGSVPDLIRSIFGSASATALCIADRESGFYAGAKNPSSSASGIFQLVSFWWDGSSAYGWRFDPFNAYQNAYHAHLLYLASGWSPWGGGCG